MDTLKPMYKRHVTTSCCLLDWLPMHRCSAPEEGASMLFVQNRKRDEARCLVDDHMHKNVLLHVLEID